MAYRVAGGPIGRVVDSRVGDEMVTTSRRDLARLKALAEEQTRIRASVDMGPGRPERQSS
jgi:hypothetical protein